MYSTLAQNTALLGVPVLGNRCTPPGWKLLESRPVYNPWIRGSKDGSVGETLVCRWWMCVCVWEGTGNRVQKVEEWVFCILYFLLNVIAQWLILKKKKTSTTHKALKEVSVYRHLLACAWIQFREMILFECVNSAVRTYILAVVGAT